MQDRHGWENWPPPYGGNTPSTPTYPSASSGLSAISSPVVHSSNGNGSNGNGHQFGDLRERVAELEVHRHYEREDLDRLFAKIDRMANRMTEGDKRMNALDATDQAQSRQLADLVTLPARVDRWEERVRRGKERLAYMAAALVLGLTLSGQLTLDNAAWAIQAALALFVKVVGPG